MDEATNAAALLADRVAVVTGAGGGIGAATARLFAQHGAQVVVADIDANLAGRTVDDISSSGGSAVAIVADVRDADQVDGLARSVLDRFGRVDVLVNNVGHWLRHPGNFVDTDPRLWDELYRINLHHVFLVSHAFLPAMIDRQRRRDRQRLVAGRAARLPGGSGVRRLQSRRHPVHPQSRGPGGPRRRARQRDRPRRHRIAPGALLAVAVRRGTDAVAAMGSGRTDGAARGPGPRDPFPGLGPVGVRHRPHDPHRRRYRRGGRLVPLIAPDPTGNGRIALSRRSFKRLLRRHAAGGQMGVPSKDVGCPGPGPLGIFWLRRSPVPRSPRES